MNARKIAVAVVIALGGLLVAEAVIITLAATHDGERSAPVARPAFVTPPIEIDARAQSLAQTRITESVRDLLKAAGFTAAVSTTDSTIVIELPSGQCSGRVLMLVRKGLIALQLDPASEFDEMNCGELGDAISLRSKDGCVPDQTDEIVLTDEGARREKLVEGIARGVDDLSNGYIITAMGCDATVVGIAILSGGHAACDARRLNNVRDRAGAIFSQHGFIKLRCEPDGPEVMLEQATRPRPRVDDACAIYGVGCKPR